MTHRDKPPHNAQVLQRWTREWADAEHVPVARLQRTVSYLVIAAMLARSRDADDEPLFLLKGGVTMELRLDLRARACTQVFREGPANQRFRDLIDVLLLRELLAAEELPRVRIACVEIFTLRGTHPWPATLTTPDEWRAAYAQLATEMSFPLVEVDAAASAVRRLIGEIDAAR